MPGPVPGFATETLTAPAGVPAAIVTVAVIVVSVTVFTTAVIDSDREEHLRAGKEVRPRDRDRERSAAVGV